MHVFVATSQTQGTQPDDHYCCISGELVIWDTTAPARHAATYDCPCLSGFAGFVSNGRTTTALVTERPDLEMKTYVALVRSALIREQGHGRDASTLARTMASFATRFQPGDIVDRDRAHLTRRRSIADPGAMLTGFAFCENHQ
jgi:hypothetical protein